MNWNLLLIFLMSEFVLTTAFDPANSRRDLADYELPKLVNQLVLYMDGLKKFIQMNEVDIREFALQSEMLTAYLADITGQIQQLKATKNQQSVIELVVAQNRLQQLNDCKAYWDYYRNGGASCDLMLYEISELIVICSILQGPAGEPDPSVVDYHVKLTNLDQKFDELQTTRAELRRVPFILQEKLEHEFKEAKVILKNLASALTD